MKILNCILLICFAGSFAKASFLSYTSNDVTIIKMSAPKGATAQMKKIYANMGSKAPIKSVSKVYIHNGVFASHQKNGDMFIQDYVKDKFINVNFKDKTYHERSAVGTAEKSIGATQMKSMSLGKYKKINESKKVMGKSCQFYTKETVMNIGSKHLPKGSKMKSKTKTKGCILKKSPAAWTEFSLMAAKKFGQSKMKEMKKIVAGNPEVGMVVYSETQHITSSGAGGVAGMPMPKTLVKMTVSKMSTKPFDLNKLQVPKGFKKIEVSVPY